VIIICITKYMSEKMLVDKYIKEAGCAAEAAITVFTRSIYVKLTIYVANCQIYRNTNTNPDPNLNPSPIIYTYRHYTATSPAHPKKILTPMAAAEQNTTLQYTQLKLLNSSRTCNSSCSIKHGRFRGNVTSSLFQLRTKIS